MHADFKGQLSLDRQTVQTELAKISSIFATGRDRMDWERTSWVGAVFQVLHISITSCLEVLKVPLQDIHVGTCIHSQM